MERAYWHLPEPSLEWGPSGYLPDPGSWGGWVPTRFSDRVCWVAGEEPKELEFVDGVLCEARLLAQELAMKNGDNERVVEARPVRVPPRPLMYPPRHRS